MPRGRRRARREGGDILLGWTRRSRQGFDWLDGVDAPLAEEREAYALKLLPAGGSARTVECGSAGFVYTAAMQAADAGGVVSVLSVEVAQLSALSGAGATAARSFSLG